MPVAYMVGIALVASAVVGYVVARLGPRVLSGRLAGQEPGMDRRPPRLGGLLALAATLAVGRWAGLDVPSGWGPLLPWILGMYAVGFLDDLIDLPPRAKFLGQAVICLGLSAYVSFSPLATPSGTGLDLGALAVPFTVFWLLLLVNAFNMVDGADGLAGGLVLLLSGATALLAADRGRGDLAPWLALYAGAHAGFLFLNWRPARLYLGDSGSMGAGLVLGLAGILGTSPPHATVGLHTNALLFWLPLSELALTVGRRWIRGHALFRGDDRHIHHMLVRGGRREDVSVGILLVLSGLTALAAYVSVGWRSLPVALLIGSLILVTVVGVQALGYVELRVVADRIVRLLSMSRRRGDTLVRVAEAAHAVRAARSWPELHRALHRLVEGGVVLDVQVASRPLRGGGDGEHAWTLESVLGPEDRPGYLLLTRSTAEGHGKIRPEDVRLYLVPAVEAALDRIRDTDDAEARERNA